MHCHDEVWELRILLIGLWSLHDASRTHHPTPQMHGPYGVALPMQSKAHFYEHFEDWAIHSHCMRIECTRLLTGDFRLEITW